MHRSKQGMISRLVMAGALVSAFQLGHATNVPMTKEVKNLVDFQCHGATTLKQAEANYANMSRGFTDQHPVMECLKKRIEELKAAGK